MSCPSRARRLPRRLPARALLQTVITKKTFLKKRTSVGVDRFGLHVFVPSTIWRSQRRSTTSKAS